MCSQVRTLACNFSLNLLHQRYTTNECTQVPPVREQHLLGTSYHNSFDRFFLVPMTTHLHMQLVSGSIILLARMKERLSSLTHLAITFVFPPPEMFKSLAPLLSQLLESETLQVLLVQDASLARLSPLVEAINHWNWVEQIRLKDNRLVAVKALQSSVRQWKDTPLVYRNVCAVEEG
ncbi:hypothetical protein BDQ17DRAFT_1343761 [Cyathus striatus]|nr:hypothetical protein BDQ17DRAFT_1343761 [Cyathus striatus]